MIVQRNSWSGEVEWGQDLMGNPLVVEMQSGLDNLREMLYLWGVSPPVGPYSSHLPRDLQGYLAHKKTPTPIGPP